MTPSVRSNIKLVFTRLQNFGSGGSVLLWHREGEREELVEAVQSAALEGMAFPAGAAQTGCVAKTSWGS